MVQNLLRLSQDGEQTIFSENLCAKLFNDDLSNEHTVSQIHLTGQYLLSSGCLVKLSSLFEHTHTHTRKDLYFAFMLYSQKDLVTRQNPNILTKIDTVQ